MVVICKKRRGPVRPDDGEHALRITCSNERWYVFWRGHQCRITEGQGWLLVGAAGRLPKAVIAHVEESRTVESADSEDGNLRTMASRLRDRLVSAFGSEANEWIKRIDGEDELPRHSRVVLEAELFGNLSAPFKKWLGRLYAWDGLEDLVIEREATDR